MLDQRRLPLGASSSKAHPSNTLLHPPPPPFRLLAANKCQPRSLPAVGCYLPHAQAPPSPPHTYTHTHTCMCAYRTDYKQLGCLKRSYPGVPIMAVTATATDRVAADILSTLGMRSAKVFKVGSTAHARGPKTPLRSCSHVPRWYLLCGISTVALVGCCCRSCSHVHRPAAAPFRQHRFNGMHPHCVGMRCARVRVGWGGVVPTAVNLCVKPVRLPLRHWRTSL
eukprot:364197-Chlamydomonas_euryale.AAC.13